MGKNVASATVEAELDPKHLYTVKIIATTGDMLIYALKMWPGDAEGIQEVNPDNQFHVTPPSYNLWGQRVGNNHGGIVIQDGTIMIR